eukprot:CAMPEP_0174730042 /NCGR_PEP_ID=MMETSP1094-20130205/54811_1 /TAXON_ID=156173 /ORGANISM="Chrysochromulina brevifilum, Strain UTEX LB 985" /LENGTH=44 /DNA_ID= /DNA_START= /DNA_END= /DNA_ORIENTATION=
MGQAVEAEAVEAEAQADGVAGREGSADLAEQVEAWVLTTPPRGL